MISGKGIATAGPRRGNGLGLGLLLQDGAGGGGNDDGGGRGGNN